MAMNKRLGGGKRIVCLLVAAVLMVLAMSLGLLLWNQNRSHMIALPEENEVVSIRAIAHGDNFPIFAMELTPEFTIPPEYYPVILGVLNPDNKAADVPKSCIDPPLGDLQITTKSGRVIKVRWGWSGQNPLCFAVDGVRCRRSGPYRLRDDFGIDESARLFGLLLEIHREQTGHEKSKHLPYFIEDLEWSTGRRLSGTK